jgi:intracellular sulfur oxidation DsrE/DsrF family protein
MNKFTDQQLDAFVDGQLDRNDRTEILGAMENSGDVRNKVADVRRLKDLIQLTYQDEKPNYTHSPITPKRFWSHAVAAVLGALSMLVVMQMTLTPAAFKSSASNHETARMPGDTALLPSVTPMPERVLFHLSNSDKLVAEELLNQVELVADQFQKIGRELRIIVITNNEGLRLYQTSYSDQAERIGELYRRYDNIIFAACGTTLGRFTEAGEKSRLLPEVIVVDSGVAEITRRQSQGWKYIRI